MKTPLWLLGPLFWDIARYLKHYGTNEQISLFASLYNEIPALQKQDQAGLTNPPQEIAAILTARALALGQEISTARVSYAPKSLRSIFSSLRLREDEIEQWYLPIQPLHRKPELQRSNAVSNKAMQAHLLRFTAELQFLHQNRSSDKLETVLALVEKYFWCLAPWDLQHETDVPLYALAKISTAIIACWPRRDEELERIPAPEEQTYALICGDISGIQKYIYRISSAKGVAKGLKARSFELAILADAIAKSLLHEISVQHRFPLTAANLIYSSGGKFYLLTPDWAADLLNEKEPGSLSCKLAQQFWEKYRGELFLGLGAVRLCGNDFMANSFGDKWQEVSKQCEAPKRAKFRRLMPQHYHEIFGAHGEGGEAKTCEVCGLEESKDVRLIKVRRPNTAEERDLCPFCKETEDLGKALAKANLIAEVIVTGNTASQNVQMLNPLGREFSYYIFNLSEKFELPDRPVTFYNLNIHEYPDEKFLMLKLDNRQVNCAFRFYGGNQIPRGEEGEPLDYDKLAEASRGLKRLGVLRMDVDFLGRIFAEGLKPHNNAARVLTLSWHLNYYFSGRLNKLRENPAFNETLIVYSGGDDLFIVGAWDQVIELAQEIHKDFGAYTKNPQLTISGGMVMVPEKFPIHKSAILSGKAEDAAKEIDGVLRRLHHAQNNVRAANAQASPPDLDSRKDGITFLDKSLRWHDFEITVSIKNALHTALTLEPAALRLDNGIVTRLRQIYALYEMPRPELKKLRRTHAIDLKQYMDLMAYNKWRWRLVYALRRFKDHHKEHEVLIENLQHALIDNEWQPCVWQGNGWQNQNGDSMKASDGVSIVSFIDVPARWVEFLIRKEK